MHSVANSRYARIADGHFMPSSGQRAAHPNAAICKPRMHAYTLGRMIIRWRERSLDYHGSCRLAQARATLLLTRR